MYPTLTPELAWQTCSTTKHMVYPRHCQALPFRLLGQWFTRVISTRHTRQDGNQL